MIRHGGSEKEFKIAQSIVILAGLGMIITGSIFIFLGTWPWAWLDGWMTLGIIIDAFGIMIFYMARPWDRKSIFIASPFLVIGSIFIAYGNANGWIMDAWVTIGIILVGFSMILLCFAPFSRLKKGEATFKL